MLKIIFNVRMTYKNFVNDFGNINFIVFNSTIDTGGYKIESNFF